MTKCVILILEGNKTNGKDEQSQHWKKCLARSGHIWKRKSEVKLL